MSNAAMWLVGIAAVGGIALAVSHANAAEAPPGPAPEPDPLPPSSGNGGATAPGGSPAGAGTPASGGSGGAGSGTPTTPPEDPNFTGPIDLLPAVLQNIDLSGNEVAEFTGLTTVYPHMFYTWIVHHTLNDMDLTIYVSLDHPDEWISAFWHEDPDGSTPEGHFILFHASDTPGKDWMMKNLLHINTPAPPDFS